VRFWPKSVGMAFLALTLVGCMDMSVDVALTGPTTATATLTQTLVADFNAMRRMGDTPEQQTAADYFCVSGALTQNADGSATCAEVIEVSFGTGETLGDGGISFAEVGQGVVRIAMSTKALRDEVEANDPLVGEVAGMAEAMFRGRTFTVRFSGAEVVETNMTLSQDRRSAQTVVPFVDLVKATAKLPEEFFAVVRVP
jgi:hypothetical protein